MDFKAKKVLVIGMARSGVAVAGLLARHGARVLVNDTKTAEALGDALKELDNCPVERRLGEDPMGIIPEMDALVISPGVPIHVPVVKYARAHGIPVLAEIEVAYQLSHGALVAITGTNGKTTTTTLTSQIFKNAGKKTYTVGNIGYPYSCVADESANSDVTVCEISSFQMETADTFRPNVSAVLNITEDHLNRHGDMETYIAMKRRIFENQRCDDVCVLNYDDPATRNMAKAVRCRVVWFSRRERVDGAYAQDGVIYYGLEQPRAICRADELRIPGKHNLENALAAVAMAVNSGVADEIIARTLREFEGVEHRIEFVREVAGVRYINDSKGTNPDSTIKAIETMDRPTVIILGGSVKNSDYLPMAKLMVETPSIVSAVVIGQTQDEIAAALDAAGFKDYVRVNGFANGVAKARELAQRGGNVLLSPACASFDEFKDFEERGEVFKRLVAEMV